ncbi:cytochrome P450 2D9-like [Acanthaster planci]|uniref:Cytochrome P450 2D9-like n=1 Tax=Acanthaster planci TaxID=133434 RepID=A0A8B7XMV9_ACAPL|nr:cytochrome P450 2D9-like [Acanthaster planci]
MAVVDNVIAVLTSAGNSSSVVFLLCLVATFLVTALVWRHLTYWRKYTFPPGPRGWPLIGNSPLIAPDSGQTNANITRIGKQYHPDMFTLTLYLGKRMLILNSYESIKDAFVKQSALVSDRPSVWPFTYINENHRNVGVFLEPYTETWKREKKYMVRTVRQFGYGTSGSEDVILREANHLVELFKKRGGEPFEPGRPLSLCFLNATFSMILNTTYEEDDEEFATILDYILQWYVEIFKLYNVEPLLPLYDRLGLNSRLRKGKMMTKELLAFIQKHVDYHKATLDPDNPRDMIDSCLIELAKGDPNSDLREFTNEKFLWMLWFFIPDQGDTASGLFLFLLLATALHPEVQQRVFQEIQDVIGDRPPSLKDKENMPYTEAVILETLRMDTTFWLLVPHFTADDVEILGFKIPKDTTVIPNIYAVHFDPELWDDPEDFKPERFIDKHGRINRPDYFMPYSTGRRSCVGEQLSQKQFFLFYITLIQKFKFKLPDGDPIPKLESQWLWVSPPYFRLQATTRD